MNKLNQTMVKEFYKHNKEVQNKKTYELDIKRNVFKHGRRFFIIYYSYDFQKGSNP